MRLRWVNHASFVLEHGDVRLITDPWLAGSAFDRGWSLLSRSPFDAEDFPEVTHLWLSHEHPDHFHPPTLRAIPAQRRRRITVLFQQTRDRKVVRFCRELGFGRVVELPPGAWHQLGEGVRIMCQPVPPDDSWLAVEAGGKLLLNLNDCIIEKRRQAEAIRERLGRSPDVLLTQFSYASWVGNRGDIASQRGAAREVLDRVRLQCEVLQPRQAIPFASFVRFSHEENAYLNEGMNSVEDAYEEIDRHTGAEPVVLYPGDAWEVSLSATPIDRLSTTPKDREPHDSACALARYAADARRWEECPRLTPTPPVEMVELVGSAGAFRQRLIDADTEGRLGLLERTGLLRPAHIYLSDHQRAIGFSVKRGLAPSRRPRERCDVELTAAALRYCFENAWGGDTLLVNGRFQVPPGGDFTRFRRYLGLSSNANHGRTLLDYGKAKLGKVVGRVLGAWC